MIWLKFYWLIKKNCQNYCVAKKREAKEKKWDNGVRNSNYEGYHNQGNFQHKVHHLKIQQAEVLIFLARPL